MIAPELDDFAAEQERIADLRARGDFAPKTDPGFVFPVPMEPEDLAILDAYPGHPGQAARRAFASP
jgi:hypothetical protein